MLARWGLACPLIELNKSFKERLQAMETIVLGHSGLKVVSKPGAGIWIVDRPRDDNDIGLSRKRQKFLGCPDIQAVCESDIESFPFACKTMACVLTGLAVLTSMVMGGAVQVNSCRRFVLGELPHIQSRILTRLCNSH